MQPRIDYKLYPTLLDAWWKFQNQRLEDFFYQDEQGAWHTNYDEKTGEYRYSQQEMDTMLEQELIDKINRVPTEPSEAASKGTIFNEIVDCIIERRGCHHEGWTVESVADEQGNKTTIHGALDGFDFMFDAAFCKSVAAYFAGALPQYYVEAIIPVRYGNVLLYGWIDELCKDEVKDIKTTKRYDFGQYYHYWQRHVYPYCLIEHGDCKSIKGFEFTVIKWSGSKKAITGEMYKEYYTYDHCESSALLRQECERFIEWLDANKDKITNNKIFGE